MPNLAWRKRHMSHFTEGCGGTDIPPVGLAESSFCCWRRRHVIPPFSLVRGGCPPFHVTERGRVNTLNAYITWYFIHAGLLGILESSLTINFSLKKEIFDILESSFKYESNGIIFM
jgi:hypothetical protein